MHSWHSENIMHGDLIFLVQNMSTKDEIVLNQVVMFCFYLWFLFLFPDLFVWLRTRRSFCTSDFTKSRKSKINRRCCRKCDFQAFDWLKFTLTTDLI